MLKFGPLRLNKVLLAVVGRHKNGVPVLFYHYIFYAWKADCWPAYRMTDRSQTVVYTIHHRIASSSFSTRDKFFKYVATLKNPKRKEGSLILKSICWWCKLFYTRKLFVSSWTETKSGLDNKSKEISETVSILSDLKTWTSKHNRVV